MAMVKNWLKWIIYTLLAVLAIGTLLSVGVVFLVIGVIVGIIILVGIVAYLIKDFWEYSVSRK